MRHTRFRAIVPALALVLALAANAWADCAEEIDTDSVFGTGVLITSYETKEDTFVVLWGIVPMVIPVTYTSERGVYQTSSGSLITIECSSSFELR